jgi:hypothetical protein
MSEVNLKEQIAYIDSLKEQLDIANSTIHNLKGENYNLRNAVLNEKDRRMNLESAIKKVRKCFSNHIICATDYSGCLCADECYKEQCQK